MALIELKKVTKIYDDTAVAVQALKDFDFLTGRDFRC